MADVLADDDFVGVIAFVVQIAAGGLAIGGAFGALRRLGIVRSALAALLGFVAMYLSFGRIFSTSHAVVGDLVTIGIGLALLCIAIQTFRRPARACMY